MPSPKKLRIHSPNMAMIVTNFTITMASPLLRFPILVAKATPSELSNIAISAMMREIRAPYMKRVQTSRPKLSVPSRCSDVPCRCSNLPPSAQAGGINRWVVSSKGLYGAALANTPGSTSRINSKKTDRMRRNLEAGRKLRLLP